MTLSDRRMNILLNKAPSQDTAEMGPGSQHLCIMKEGIFNLKKSQ